jgi:hypothetical protein
MDSFLPGDRVQILERGEWTGPFTVTPHTGRTPDHLVLAANGVAFEHCADTFNTRHVPGSPTPRSAWGTPLHLIDGTEYCLSCERDNREGHYDNCQLRAS